MKKTRILVPALAILALGTAASVTGTVAWFTENREVSAHTMYAAVTANQDLRISDNISTYSWGSEIAWDAVSHTNQTMSPVTAIAGSLTATTASLANAENASLTADPAFIVPKGSNTINADTGAATTAVAASAGGSDNSAAYEGAAATAYMTEDFALKYEGSTGQGVLTANVYGKVTITCAAGENIDLALRVGIYNVTDSKFTAYNLGDTAAAGYTIALETLVYTNASPKNFKVYVWYEGTDLRCKNANAVNHPLQVKFDFSLNNINA